MHLPPIPAPALITRQNEAWARGVLRFARNERKLLIDVRPKGTN